MSIFDRLHTFLINKSSKHNAKTMMQENSRIIGEGVRSELDGPSGRRISELLLLNWPQSEISQLLTHELIQYIYLETLYHARRNRDVIEEVVEKYPNLNKEQATSIVISVASKANSIFSRIRMVDIGIRWYEWSTCKDARVRPSHRKMEGVLVSWAEPPSPERLIGKPPIGTYHAGEGIECRCCAFAVVDPDYIKFPRRVYWGGQIRVMKKAEFMKIF